MLFCNLSFGVLAYKATKRNEECLRLTLRSFHQKESGQFILFSVTKAMSLNWVTEHRFLSFLYCLQCSVVNDVLYTDRCQLWLEVDEGIFWGNSKGNTQAGHRKSQLCTRCTNLFSSSDVIVEQSMTHQTVFTFICFLSIDIW